MKKPIWQPPTRRAFVTMLGLGAALAVVKTKQASVNIGANTEEPTTPPMLWIGHC